MITNTCPTHGPFPATTMFDVCPRCTKDFSQKAVRARLEAVANSVYQAPKVQSDGSTASYYELPQGATELQHLISHRNMNAQVGEIFRACYRYGMVAHSPEIRDIKKIIFYAKAELERLEKLNAHQQEAQGADSSAT